MYCLTSKLLRFLMIEKETFRQDNFNENCNVVVIYIYINRGDNKNSDAFLLFKSSFLIPNYFTSTTFFSKYKVTTRITLQSI